LPGTLYVIATPIGNLSDIAPRVSEALSKCDFILAEDTRVSIKILNRLDIHKKMISCHDFSESSRVSLVEEAAQNGTTVALVSDAGTPLVSDPGYKIVSAAIESGMTVIPIPGPSAFLLALVGSGLPTDRFAFEGFLPDKPTAIKKQLESIKQDTRTLVFYVSPHKVSKTLNAMQEVLGNRKACLARELTKIHEEFIRGTIEEIATQTEKREVLGECVMVCAGYDPLLAEEEDETTNVATVESEVKSLLASGMGVKEISQVCAKKFGWKRSKMYRTALAISKQ